MKDDTSHFSEDDIAWANCTWGRGNWTTVWDEETKRWAMLHKNNPKVQDRNGVSTKVNVEAHPFGVLVAVLILCVAAIFVALTVKLCIMIVS